MQKHPTKCIFIGFAENGHLSLNFRTGYSLVIFTLSAKKLISTNLAIFGFFPSKKHDSVFLKNYRFWLRFQYRIEFCMQKHPTKCIFIGFAENGHLSLNFRTGYSLVIFTLSAKKLISTNLAIFGFFPSKKHDSVDIRNFCLILLAKITKNRK